VTCTRSGLRVLELTSLCVYDRRSEIKYQNSPICCLQIGLTSLYMVIPAVLSFPQAHPILFWDDSRFPYDIPYDDIWYCQKCLSFLGSLQFRECKEITWYQIWWTRWGSSQWTRVLGLKFHYGVYFVAKGLQNFLKCLICKEIFFFIFTSNLRSSFQLCWCFYFRDTVFYKLQQLFPPLVTSVSNIAIMYYWMDFLMNIILPKHIIPFPCLECLFQ
jgi:hypothetical protein